MANARKHAALYRAAVEAAKKAVDACTPVPMVVREADGLSDRPKPGGKEWFVADGVCGFAWIEMRGTSSFARWAKAQEIGRVYSSGGLHISAFTLDRRINQSLQKGEAAARAAAEVLRAGGVECYPNSRID